MINENGKLPTEFAPAERNSLNSIAPLVESLQHHPGAFLLDATPTSFVILNDKRQIVYANKVMRELIQSNGNPNAIYGKRPGEALNCVHASESEGGCGTTRFCSQCGAVRAIMQGLHGEVSVEECRISTNDGEALDLKVWATPWWHDGRQHVMFAVQDISGEKRRRALERIFFHDVLNTAGVISMAVELMNLKDITYEEVADDLAYSTRHLIDEIKSQQLLSSAENEELELSPTSVSPHTLMTKIANMAAHYAFARNINIVVDANPEGPQLYTDAMVLSRILTNMTKNALEASSEGDTVTLTCVAQPEAMTFGVHNPTYMPHDVQLQVFQRSFSTKGRGRGLGTYSIKLLSERYLQGRVWFESDVSEGTTFKVSLPLILNMP